MSNSLKDRMLSRLPLFLVFLSGIGFSIQTLIVKILSVNLKFFGSFECVCARGFIQLIISAVFVWWNTHSYKKQVKEYEETNNKSLIELLDKPPGLFGDTNYVRLMIFLRSVIGYGGISLTFLATEYIPISDSIVLSMLSPLIASINSFLFLGESISVYEGSSIISSLVGTVLVAKPSFLFPNNAYDNISPSDHTKGVVAALMSSLFAGYAYMFVRILGTSAKMPWSNVCFSQAIGQIVLSLPFIFFLPRSGPETDSETPSIPQAAPSSEEPSDAPVTRLLSFLFMDATASEPISGEEDDYFMQNRNFLIVFFIFMAGFVGAWSQIAMTIGMQREKSAAATAMRMSDIVMGFIWQFIFTGDKISPLSVLGAFIIVFSILIIVIFKTDSSASASTVSSSLETAQRRKDAPGEDYKYNMIEMQQVEIEGEGSDEFQFLHSLQHKMIYSSDDDRDYHYLDHALRDDSSQELDDLERNFSKKNNLSSKGKKKKCKSKAPATYSTLHIDDDDRLSD